MDDLLQDVHRFLHERQQFHHEAILRLQETDQHLSQLETGFESEMEHFNVLEGRLMTLGCTIKSFHHDFTCTQPQTNFPRDFFRTGNEKGDDAATSACSQMNQPQFSPSSAIRNSSNSCSPQSIFPGSSPRHSHPPARISSPSAASTDDIFAAHHEQFVRMQEYRGQSNNLSPEIPKPQSSPYSSTRSAHLPFSTGTGIQISPMSPQNSPNGLNNSTQTQMQTAVQPDAPISNSPQPKQDVTEQLRATRYRRMKNPEPDLPLPPHLFNNSSSLSASSFSLSPPFQQQPRSSPFLDSSSPSTSSSSAPAAPFLPISQPQSSQMHSPPPRSTTSSPFASPATTAQPSPQPGSRSNSSSRSRGPILGRCPSPISNSSNNESDNAFSSLPPTTTASSWAPGPSASRASVPPQQPRQHRNPNSRRGKRPHSLDRPHQNWPDPDHHHSPSSSDSNHKKDDNNIDLNAHVLAMDQDLALAMQSDLIASDSLVLEDARIAKMLQEEENAKAAEAAEAAAQLAALSAPHYHHDSANDSDDNDDDGFGFGHGDLSLHHNQNSDDDSSDEPAMNAASHEKLALAHADEQLAEALAREEEARFATQDTILAQQLELQENHAPHWGSFSPRPNQNRDLNPQYPDPDLLAVLAGMGHIHAMRPSVQNQNQGQGRSAEEIRQALLAQPDRELSYEDLISLDATIPNTKNATVHQLNALPQRKLEKNIPDKCSVCLCEMKKGETVRTLPCLHMFHTECVDPWLLKRNKICPTCQQSIVPENP